MAAHTHTHTHTHIHTIAHTPDLHREMPGQASKEPLQARTDCIKTYPRGGAIGNWHTHMCFWRFVHMGSDEPLGGSLAARLGTWGAPVAQCGRSATIWVSSCTGDPYFVILGASLLPLA